jgi:acyl phosphate:glycerol-3-phosphate acyltransferase
MLHLLLDSFFIIFAYFMGSVPYGLVVAKYAGIGDIRKKGSGNIGATNVLRNGGKKLGIITLALDVIKGFIPVLLAKKFGSEWAASLAAFAAVLGHIFPVWLEFKGGKGVATTLAAYAALAPGLFIFSSITWLVIFFISRLSSLSSITMMIASPIIAIFFYSNSVIIVTFSLSAVVIYKHKENIVRILKGQEFGFSAKKS